MAGELWLPDGEDVRIVSIMLEPGTHEDTAHKQVADDDKEAATVSALLAIASAVNRLADVLDNKD